MSPFILRVLDSAFPWIAVAAGAVLFLIVPVPVAIYVWKILTRKTRKPTLFGSARMWLLWLLSAALVGAILEIYVIVAEQAAHEVQSYLGRLQAARVLNNGELSPDSIQMLDALRSMSQLPAHHSHPEQEIRVDVFSDRGHLVLLLGRDSECSDEYWVFYPRYNATRRGEIGRIRTHSLDGY